MNAFFKPVYGTALIASGSTPTQNYLFNVDSPGIIEIPAHGDPGPSPDGRFVTILNAGGLEWYATDDFSSGGRKLLLWDPGLRTYQSVGQLSLSKYRVLGALSSSTNPAGLIVREFESRTAEDGQKAVVPLAEWRSVCDGKRISIPMMSKTGQLLSGSFEGTLRVFRIGADAAECDEVFDTGPLPAKRTSIETTLRSPMSRGRRTRRRALLPIRSSSAMSVRVRRSRCITVTRMRSWPSLDS
jgi:hypothetical protein